ncbi:MAG: hypothetical protein ACTHU0_16170 [Kofleriaceae bacterium]
MTSPFNIEVRPATNRLFVSDLDHVKVFELTRGTLIARFVPNAKSCPHTVGQIEVSPDGQRFIACSALVEAPFEAAVRNGVVPGYRAFWADSKLLVEQWGKGIGVMDLARRKVVWTLPDRPLDLGVENELAHDGRRVFSIREKGVLVADEGASTWRVLTTFATPWRFVTVARQGTAALGRTETSLVHLDLRTGASTVLGTEDHISAISPSGERIAITDNRDGHSGFLILRPSGETIATVPTPPAGDVTFADENVIAYREDHTIQIYDLTQGLKHFDAPSRFRGWATDTTALVERDGAWQQLAVATLATSPTAPIKHAAPPGAPTWATSWSSTPSGEPVASDLAAEPPPLWDSYKDGCRETLRVWTAKGGEHQLAVPSNPSCYQWQASGGRVARLTERTIDVYDATTARLVAHLDVPRYGDRGRREPSDNPDLAHRYWTASLSPTGKHLALWWRRADVWTESRYSDDGWNADPECDSSWAASFFEFCHSEYFAELWSLEGKPKRIWQRRWTSKIDGLLEDQPKKATSPIAFTHDGKHVLLGFSDGDILVQSTASGGQSRVETLHHAPIARIEVSPGDTYVFSEDSDGEQRIWPLVRP